ncbi:MAG: alanine racemase [Bacteroidales bacterium]|nr:alanine racemase [Bacteroidales bacterium]
MNYKNIEVERLLTDSRKLFTTYGTLFVALRGQRHDGAKYVADLYARGVRAFVCHSDFDVRPYPDARFILCDDTTRELQQIAKQKRRMNHGRVVAIVGSNGKTIVKDWLGELVGGDMLVVRSPRSYNSQVGVALSLWNIEPETQLSIIEAGISEPGEMARLEEIVEPDDVIITNLGQAHQENFSSLEQKLEEKLVMARNAKRIFYCADNQKIAEYIESRFPDAEKIGWHKSDTQSRRILERFGFKDDISCENIMHAANYALAIGVDIETLAMRASQVESISMRLEQKDGHNNCTIIDDAYNADIDSLALALDSLHQLGDKKGLSRTVILSDLQQTGLCDEELYARVGRLLDEKKVSRLIGIGPHISMAMQQRRNSVFFASTNDFCQRMSTADFRNEAILLKASRTFEFERIASLLEQKRHRTVMKVNLDALAHNIAYFRSFLKPNTKLLAMVKAYSYGTGSFEIAKLMQQQGVDYLGVAFADEGFDLRASGISLPIIVMNPEQHSFDLMLENNLEPELSTVESMKLYSSMARKIGISQAPIHIKIDTGMKRSGFDIADMESVAKCVHECGNLRIVSAFSHLVGSDENVHDDFSQHQISIFEDATRRLSDTVGQPFMRHILNSAGIERFSDYQFEMVRLGIGLYGVSAIDNSRLHNVVTLQSYISQIRNVPAGESIGYGRKTVVSRNSRIAVVPIGYADGLDRRLSNGVGEVMIRGSKAPIAGNVCMDICMVDVTDVNDVQVGDDVVLFGDQNPVWEMSDKIGTIPYEIMTSIGRRVKRVYSIEN